MVISFDDPKVPAADGDGDTGDTPTEGDAPAVEGSEEEKTAE